MKFEWDKEKAASNLEKHGISFVAATAVFDDPYRIEKDSTARNEILVRNLGHEVPSP